MFFKSTRSVRTNFQHARKSPRRPRQPLSLWLETLEDRCVPANCTVTTPGDGGTGSLRECLNWSNANPGADSVSFNIPGAGLKTINVASPLPTITDSVVIDGYTQPGATPNTLSMGNNANLLIELNGAAAGSAHGFLIWASNSAVRGFAINRFRENGIEINGGNRNVIEGNFIGTNTSGTVGLGNGSDGVLLQNGASNNTIGGTAPGSRNLLSGNGRSGVRISNGATGNQVQGNYAGTNANGTSIIANTLSGVSMDGSARQNTIGGAVAGARNVISGNGEHGVSFSATNTHTVQGNYIGTDVSGTAVLGNRLHGVNLIDGSSNITIGGTASAARNLISGNRCHGVLLDGSSATNNRVLGNYIGTNAAGSATLGNSCSGVSIRNAPGNFVGDAVAGAGNLISGNAAVGILLEGSSAAGNHVKGNFIGTNAAGAAVLPNQLGGVLVTNAHNNTIGGTDHDLDACNRACNLISGNGRAGVRVEGALAVSNLIQGNYVGTDATGLGAMGNQQAGIVISDAPNNAIGDTTPLGRNVISGNEEQGIYINGANATNIEVLGNFIGTNKNGNATLPNRLDGVLLSNATNNIIGGTNHDAGICNRACNLISGNRGAGIWLHSAVGNRVQGNYLGSNAVGTAALGNSMGVVVVGGSSNNTIGGLTPEARNLISGNVGSGIYLGQSSGNLVQGNYLGINASGMTDLANENHGVIVTEGAVNNTIGGTTAAARNVISGNRRNGILIEGVGTTGNRAQGNYLGTNAAGTAALPNSENGIRIFSAGNFVVGNVISGNAYFGVALTGTDAANNTIQGNYIGTNAAGTGRLGNGYDGVLIYDAPNNLIGGPFTTAGNLISANGRAGVMIFSSGATGNRVQGNRIGTNWQGGSGLLGNNYGGVYLYGASHNLIGDASFGELGNEIAFNLHNGVTVVDGVGNGIRGNSIFDNAKLGIDIHDNDVSWWNLAWLYGGWTYPGFTYTQGFVYGEPWTQFEVELFANSDGDPSGYGEGELFLGRETVFTDDTGLGYFQSVLYTEVPSGYCLTATATIIRNNLPFGETWEFGNCALVEAYSSPGRGAGGDLPAALRRVDLVRPLTAATLPRQERLDATTVLDHAFPLAALHPSADTVFSTVPNHGAALFSLDLAALDALALDWLSDE